MIEDVSMLDEGLRRDLAEVAAMIPFIPDEPDDEDGARFDSAVSKVADRWGMDPASVVEFALMMVM